MVWVHLQKANTDGSGLLLESIVGSGIVSARTVTQRAEREYVPAMNVKIHGGGIEQGIQTDDSRCRVCGFGYSYFSTLLMGDQVESLQSPDDVYRRFADTSHKLVLPGDAEKLCLACL